MSAVLVTGGLGVNGSWVTRRLAEQGVEVVSYDVSRDIELIKDISDNIEEKTSLYYIIFRTTINFAAIYTQKRGFWLDVKIPRNEFNMKGLDVRKHKDPIWTHIRVNENTDLSLLIKAAKEAYERTL